MKWNLILLALCIALPGCRPKVPPPATPEEVRTLVMDSNRMALDFYRDLRGPGNMAFTPLGLCEPLALLAWGADGTMREELQQRMHLKLPPERVPIAVEALRKQINCFDPGTYLSPGDQPPQLDFAMALWADRTNPVPWSTRRAVPVLMNAEASNLDFGGDRAGTRATMARWSTRHLEGLEVDADFGELPVGGFVLAATTSFGARWSMPFRPEMTQTAPFHRLDGKDEPLPLMHHHEHWPYVVDGDCKATSLDYIGNGLEMVVLLPAPGRFQAVEEGLDLARLDRIITGLHQSSYNSVKAEVFLPRFAFTSQIDLGKVLEQRGLGSFLSGRNRLPRLQAHASGYPSSATQDTRFEVDEKGTRAASLTLVCSLGMAKTHPFRADRPFLFVVRDQHTGAIIYLGRFVGTTSEVHAR